MAQRPLVICPVSGATTVIFCAVSLITVCICFSLLRLQSEQINELRNDLMALKMNVEKADIIKRSAYCSGVERQCASVGRRTFLHLRASSFVSYDKDDYTAIQWTAAGSQGEGLEVSGETVTVATEGPYFIYSQVLYKGTTWSMGHVITKRPNGTEHSNGTNIMMCAKNMPDNSKIKALNSCYTAGIFFLESGTVLELYVPRKSAELDRRSHATFFGISSLWQ
ncbi:tumor necrosis factor ligand superfamily member 13 isoform X2 [Sardina pilchardus]|uniref:tumor necrosis factor ligand superfamily member 13 isoform X2 n=1 Tax=Sardina pilchardus TaxID=27697 RepID=UPI002E0D1BC8